LRKKVVLGIDIGGTNTKFGLVDIQGKIYIQHSLPTNAENPPENLLERLFAKLKEMLAAEQEEYQIVGIGIGAPNGNYYSGKIESPPNLKWPTVNFVQMVRKYYDVPTRLTNDANAAALGEMEFGAARGMRNFVEITLGTGLGSGIVVNGEVVYGSDGFAGELGHVIVRPGGRKCGCGRNGCLEAYASATGIRATVLEMIGNNEHDSSLATIPVEKLTAKDIFDAAEAGDQLAKEAFKFTGEILGHALANTVAHLSPEAFILFGGLASAGELLFNPVKQALEESVLYIFRGKCKIVNSGLAEGQAAILGASALIWHELHMTQN
jgi:glucokinase